MRPRKDKEERRDVVIPIRLTLEEKRDIVNYAKKDFDFPSSWVRKKILGFVYGNQK